MSDTKNHNPKVLVVDDDSEIIQLVHDVLKPQGYHTLQAFDGESALKLFQQSNPDVVLLDIMMPGLDGFEVCERIREISQVPIIMLTAKVNDDDKVLGFDTGADDYVTKPFSSKELVARIRAALRRPTLSPSHSSRVFTLYDMRIDFNRRKVFLGNKEVRLGTKEYRIVNYLARNAGRVVESDTLLKEVWGDEAVGNSHLLQVNVERLRRKLSKIGTYPDYIVTEHGTGYLMAKEK